MTNFVDTVNEIMVIEGVLGGDDDPITSFSSSQHAASIRLAKRSVTQELAFLTSREFIPYENADAVLTVSGRTATLISDFVRFQDEIPFLLETDVSGTSAGTYILEYPGGEKRLRGTDFNYRENTGKPSYFYWAGQTTSTLGFYTVPVTTYYYRYYYEKEVTVTNESDTMPFFNVTEVNLFIEAAARRFKYLKATPTVREGLFSKGLENDPVIMDARAALTQMLRYKPAPKKYGRRYG